MHSILLVGPYDWDADVLPREEFTERLKAFWAALPDPSVRGALVYGESRHHGELTYLTAFTPKVRQAFAFVPRDGEPVMMVPGSKAGLTSARKLTWVRSVELLSQTGKAVAEWHKSLGGQGTRLALLGGEHVRSGLYDELVHAVGSEAAFVDASAALAPLMERKRPRELAAIRKATGFLKVAVDALRDAQRSGKGAIAAALAAEHAAIGAGAQDTQVLFSLDGGRTLRPFEAVEDKAVDPLQAYVTASCAGYWADALVSISARPRDIEANARAALQAMIRAARAGVASSALARSAREALGRASPHSMTQSVIGSSIGLSLEEAPVLRAGGAETLKAGGVYSLKTGASDGSQHAMLSAMVLAKDGGAEVLWSPA